MQKFHCGAHGTSWHTGLPSTMPCMSYATTWWWWISGLCFLIWTVPLSHTAGVISSTGPITFSQADPFDPLNPVFTLTCTSTGGPATTVTWTRDGATVSYDDDHVLTQTVVGRAAITYSNVLTVTGREPGSYQCTVVNVRGSGSSQSLMVQGEHVMFCRSFSSPLHC